MDKEQGEKRDFLPDFFEKLRDFNVKIYLEKSYGAKLGYTEKDYIRANKNIYFVERETVFKQNIIIVIRAPELHFIDLMQPNSGLISMLHYDTRPQLLSKLKKKNIHGFSLDSIVDDRNQRLVVSYELTAYGGVQAAFTQLRKKIINNQLLKGKPLKVSILGMGNLGFQAAKYSFKEFNQQKFEMYGVEGISVEFLEKEITKFQNSLEKILNETDLLIDSTKRVDSTQVIIPNQWLGYLPSNSVILDLTADPYKLNGKQIQQKAIEGIPHGNIDKYVFTSDDPAWEKDIPKEIESINRRETISCNAWPSVMARECMELYGEKIWPFLKVLLKKGFQLNVDSENHDERAISKSTVEYFENTIVQKIE